MDSNNEVDADSGYGAFIGWIYYLVLAVILGKLDSFWSVLSAIFGPPLGLAYGVNFIIFNIVKTAPPFDERPNVSDDTLVALESLEDDHHDGPLTLGALELDSDSDSFAD